MALITMSETELNRLDTIKKLSERQLTRAQAGELIQIDGSDHYWFEDRADRCTLLVFIDDATSKLQELRFVPSESTFDYFLSTKRFIERYGKPVAFYSDQYSVFRVNKKGATTGNGMTQFGRALQELNIDIICANSSQAKGRVERANITLQDRLVKELRLRDISTVTDTNAYLDEFMKDFNARFAKQPHNDKDVHRALADHDDLDNIFSRQEDRTITNSLTIQYDRVVYLLEPNEVTTSLKRKQISVYDYPDGTIEIKHKGLALTYSVFDKVRQVKQAEVVSNKRLGMVLKVIQDNQATVAVRRSKSAPKRRGQRASRAARQANPAVLR